MTFEEFKELVKATFSDVRHFRFTEYTHPNRYEGTCKFNNLSYRVLYIVYVDKWVIEQSYEFFNLYSSLDSIDFNPDILP